MIYKKEFSQIISKEIEYIFNNLNKWKIKKLFRDGYPDEIIYSIILGKYNIKPNIDYFNWINNKKNCNTCNKNI
jgi:hypothetical protein